MEEPLDGDEVTFILNDLPGRIDMNILSGPTVVEGVPENPGWTGFVIIDKSHIAIHTFTANNTISVDVYSCKMFNEETVVEYLKKHIKFRKIHIEVISRDAPE
jgi:S-adenosylmethionine/arginine decarboxylase-like enzyme